MAPAPTSESIFPQIWPRAPSGRARRKFPLAGAHCQAVDARHMPFRGETFDAVFSCYLLELLSLDDIALTLREFRRVLRDGGRLTLVLIGQNAPVFNVMYRVAGRMAPAFWGRQVERRIPELVEFGALRDSGRPRRAPGFYPSRVLVTRRRQETAPIRFGADERT